MPHKKRTVDSLVDSDIPVAPLFYTGDVHNRILSGGVDPTDIVILSRYNKKKSALKGVESLGGFPLIHFEAATGDKRALLYSTIQKFKGLEVLMHHDLKGNYDAML